MVLAEATNAALPGGMSHWTMVCLPVGIASYVNTFVAQYYGAGKRRRIGHAVQQGVWFGLACVPLMLLSIPLAPWVFAEPATTPRSSSSKRSTFRFWPGRGGTGHFGARSRAFTRVRTDQHRHVCQLAGTLLDISLEYIFIFGAFGVPRTGNRRRAALTTVISNWATVVMFWLLMRRRSERDEYGLSDARFDWPLVKRLIYFGLPSGLPQLVEAAAFTVLTMSIARVGDVAGAATSIWLTINAVAFVPMVGLNIAVSTLVGQKLGENRPNLAERATWTAIAWRWATTWSARFCI